MNVKSSASVYPSTLAPNEFGIASVGKLGHGSTVWDDVRFTATVNSMEDRDLVSTDLKITRFSQTDDSIKITIVNDTASAVRQIQVQYACIDVDQITQAIVTVPDIRQLKTGASYEYEIKPYERMCGRGGKLAVAAIGFVKTS